MSNVGSSVSYRRAEGESTEWEDLQRKYGNLPPKPKKKKSPKADEPDMTSVPEGVMRLTEAGSSALKVEALEDKSEFADDREMEELRRRRLADLKAMASKRRFGSVTECDRAGFVVEVTESSKEGGGQWVVAYLYSPTAPASRYMDEIVAVLAREHSGTKFVRIRAQDCIPGYPDKNVPTLLLYFNGKMQQQLVGTGEYGSGAPTKDSVEWVLAQRRVLKTDMTEDPRSGMASAGGSGAGSSGFAGFGGSGGGKMTMAIGRGGAGRRRGGDEDEEDDDDDF